MGRIVRRGCTPALVGAALLAMAGSAVAARAATLPAGTSSGYTAVVNFDRADYFQPGRFTSKGLSYDSLRRLDSALLFLASPTASGTVDFSGQLAGWETMRQQSADARPILVLGSLSGIVGNNAAIDALAAQVNGLATTHGLAGIDIDWEDMPGNVSVADYDTTVTRLATAVRPSGLFVSTSHAQGSQYMAYAAAVAPSIDAVNLQFYYASNNAMDMATFRSRLAAYVNGGVPAAKIRIGLPSYGMVSNSATTDKWRSWLQLVSSGADVVSGTTFTASNGETYYYSGLDLVGEKIDYAKANGFAGVFTWELSQDVAYDHPRSFNRFVDERALDAPPVLELNDTNSGTGRLGTGSVNLGTGAVLNHGVLRFARTASTAVPNRIDGSGGIEVAGRGLVTLSGTNTFTGGVVVASGTLRLGTSVAIPDAVAVSVNGGVFDVAAFAETIGTLQGTGGTITGTAGGSLSVNQGGDGAYAGAISGPVAFRKNSGGTLRLTGKGSSFTGGFTAIGGVTEVAKLGMTGSASSLGSAGVIRQNGGVISYVGQGDVTDRVITFGPSSGGGALTSVFSADGSGAIVFAAAAATPWGTGSQPRTLVLGGTSTAANTYGLRLTDNGTAAVKLLKSGAGTWVLSGSNSFSGALGVLGGTLVLGHARASGAGTVGISAGATLAIADGIEARVARLDPATAGLIDLRDGWLTVEQGLTAADAVASLVAGRGAGDWLGGRGITSSALAGGRSERLSIGWLRDDAGAVGFRVTVPGDTNLDGLVDVLDAANLLNAGTFDSTDLVDWAAGDFTYDRRMDILDVVEFLGASGYDAPATAVGVAAVPEPAVGWAAAAVIWGAFAAGRLSDRPRSSLRRS